MATIPLKVTQILYNFKSVITDTATFDADADEIIIDCAEYNTIWLAVQWLTTTDTIVVEWVLATDLWSAIWPFAPITALDFALADNNTIKQIENSPYAKIKLRKSWAAWTWVNLQLSLSANK